MFLLLLPPPSHGRQFPTDFSNMSPSHRLQLFTHCPRVGPFHRVQSFRNRLLQRGFPMGSQALPENLLQRGLLSPWVRRSLAGDCSSMGSPWGQSLLQASTCSGVGSVPRATGGYLLHRGLPRTAGDNLPHPGLHHKLQGKTFCSSISSTSSPSFFTDFGVCRVVSLT